MSDIKRLTNIEIGSGQHGCGLFFERTVIDGRPILSITVHHPEVLSEDPGPDESVFSLHQQELIALCSSLLKLTSAFSSSRYSQHGGYLLAIPSRPPFLSDDQYVAQLFFFEDSKKNLIKQNSYHLNNDLLVRELNDEWDDIHNKSITTITISSSEHADLTAFALRCLSDGWHISVGDTLNILTNSFRAIPQ